jgi:hypothetical protein
MDPQLVLARLRAIGLPRGVGRLLGAGGVAATVGTGLVLALRWAPDIADKAAERWQKSHPAPDVAYWQSSDPLSGFFTYVLSIAIVLALVAAYVAIERLVSRWRLARVFLPCASLCAFAFTYSKQKLAYPNAAIFGALGFITLVALANRGGGGARARPTPPRALAVFVLALEATALAWGGWLLTVNDGRSVALMAVFFALSFGAWRFRAGLERGGDALAHEAVGGLPLLASPLLGLMRGPSVWWVVFALAVGVVLRSLAQRSRVRLPDWAPPIAALSVASIFVIPLGLRDLPTVSLKDHEAQHLGWINSALHGKLLMADASTIYGPVREYLMTAWCLVTGTTLLQVRLAFVLLNLIGLGILLAVGWKLVARSVWLLAWYTLALLIYTPLWTMLTYKTEVSLGWADMARAGWAVLAIAGAIRAVRDLDGVELTRRRLGRVAAWGAATLLSVLYGQEQGLCALGAVLVAAAVHPIVVRRAPLRQRLVQSVAGTGAYLGGFVAATLVWLGAYATHGRAGLFLHTFFEGTNLGASGAWGASPFPVHPQSFESFTALVTGGGSPAGMAYEFLIAPAVYILTGAALLTRLGRGRWNDRATLVLALDLFGITTFRVAMHRADTYHLISSTVPAVMLLAALVADFARYRPRVRIRRAVLPLGLAAAVIVIGATFRSTFFTSMQARMDAIFLAQEVPSKGPRFVHPGVDRAGDVFVPPGIEQLVVYIRKNTSPTDPIFCRMGPMVGPEIYFLADRRDPTRYDMLAELATLTMRTEARKEIEADPPKLVIGEDGGEGPEIHAALAAWKKVATVGGVSVMAR